MSLTDELNKYSRKDLKGLRGFGDYSAVVSSLNPYLDSLSVLDSPIGEVTSRDQIINPFDLVDATFYQNTRYGQARYNQDLERAKLYAQQQEASYKEWYESPEQSALRERQSGRNPNLLDDLSSESASTQMPGGGALDNIPTNGELALNSFTALSNLFSSVAQIAALPSSIGAALSASNLSKAQADLVKEQKEGQLLSNVNAFESLVYNNVSGRLSDAMSIAAESGTKFDFDSWFSDPENFSGVYESYAPEDNSRYRAAYGRAIKNIQKLKGSAFELSSSSVRSQSNFAKLLANPYTDPDLLIQVAHMEPLMNSLMELQKVKADYDLIYQSLLDAESGAGRFNAENKYRTDYFKNVASVDDLSRVLSQVNQAIISRASAEVYKNLLAGYNQDPSSPQAMRYAALILGGSHFSLEEFLANDLINQISGGSIDLFGSSGEQSTVFHYDPKYEKYPAGGKGRPTVGVSAYGHHISFGD